MAAADPNPKSRTRKPGRPAAEPGDLRERLLDSAIAAYARAGIAGTSLRDIAREAGVTPALIAYYFGNKEALVEAVVEERILPAVAALRLRMQAAGEEPRALVEGFVRGMQDLVARHPWLPSLWVREILIEGGTLRDLLLTRVAPQIPQVLAERFAAAQDRGQLNPALDPRLLVVSLIGLTLFPLAAEPVWRRLFDADDINASTLLRHTSALLEHGLETGHAP
jgi:AcrR family transcriptional regulator